MNRENPAGHANKARTLCYWRTDAEGQALAGARVVIKGDQDGRFVAGYSDLRGVFIARQLQGAVTAATEKLRQQ